MNEDEIRSIDPSSPEGLAQLYLALWDSHPEASKLVSLKPDSAAAICSKLLHLAQEQERLLQSLQKNLAEAELKGYNRCLEDKHLNKKLVLVRRSSEGYAEMGTFRREVWLKEKIIEQAQAAGIQVEIV